MSVNRDPVLLLGTGCRRSTPGGDAVTQAPRKVSEKAPPSLPPMVIVTSRVSLVTASSCGRRPPVAGWVVKKSCVFAPLQVTSVKDSGRVAAAMTCG